MRNAHALIIVQNLSVPYDRRVWLECNSLIDAGFDVSVICPRSQGDSKREILNGVEIHRYAPPLATEGIFSFVAEFAYCFIRTFILATKINMRKKIDVIQTCNPPDTYWLLGLIFKVQGTTFVFDQHDLCPEIFDARFGGSALSPTKKLLRFLLVRLEKMNYSVANEVISTNDSYRNFAIERGGKNPENVMVVRSGPNPSRLYPIEPNNKLKRGHKHLLVYIGVMGPQDRVDIAIDAMDNIVNAQGRDDIALALLGDGDCYEDLKAQSSSLGLDDHVEFVGRAGDEIIRSYFSTASLGVAPDPATAFNSHSTHNKIMEYMIFSLPVVCFELKETLISGGDALNVIQDNADPGAFAKGIIDLIDNEDQRIKMGQYARNRVLESLVWDYQSRGYVKAMTSAFSKSKRGKLFYKQK